MLISCVSNQHAHVISHILPVNLWQLLWSGLDRSGCLLGSTWLARLRASIINTEPLLVGPMTQDSVFCFRSWQSKSILMCVSPWWPQTSRTQGEPREVQGLYHSCLVISLRVNNEVLISALISLAGHLTVHWYPSLDTWPFINIPRHPLMYCRHDRTLSIRSKQFHISYWRPKTCLRKS